MMDPNDSVALKDVISIASPFIKTLVETFVAPKLRDFRDRNKDNNDIEYLPTDEHFKEYYHRTFKKLIVVNTLVFNNSQKFLPDIFLPLTISSKDSKIPKVKVSGFPEKLSDKFGNILITDTAGMGKSTLMKTIFIDSIYTNVGIPLFIELRRLNKKKTIIDEIKEQLNSINKNFNSELLLDLLAEGEFIIILDGYDEISLDDRDIVTSDLQEFISKASNNKFFITSRPEKALTSFGNFQEFKIESLTKKEAYELLRKYDSQGSISSLLIKKLQEKDLANIQEFLTNPLLVSLLFTAFEHKQAIPFKKYLFYRQVYDANFENHDLTKGDSYMHDKYSNLEIDDFHRVLRHVGYNSLKLQRIEFSKDEILKLISESKKFCVGLVFNESDFLQDILRTVPIFAQDGNYFRWTHKSLQEYFASQYIYLDSKEDQSLILRTLYNHPNIEKFSNVLDLYYDMDYKTFQNIIEFSLLEDFLLYKESSYTDDFANISRGDIEFRKELMFLMKGFIFRFVSVDPSNPFDTKKLTTMLTKYNGQMQGENKKFAGIVLDSFISNDIYLARYQDSKVIILNLLSNKNNPIVKVLSEDYGSVELNCILENEYEIKEISDSVDDVLNSEENFKIINMILATKRMTPICIDTKIAKLRFDEIKAGIEFEEKNNFSLGGL